MMKSKEVARIQTTHYKQQTPTTVNDRRSTESPSVGSNYCRGFFRPAKKAVAHAAKNIMIMGTSLNETAAVRTERTN
jgi:hypothetical protein